MSKVTPPLKWPGGKRWLGRSLPHLISPGSQRLVEPFAGGAAVFFHSLPSNAWLNDINPDLINVYSQIREHWETVLALLLQYQHASSLPGTCRVRLHQR